MLKMLCILSVVRQGGVIWTIIISGTSLQPVKYSPHPCQCFMYIAFIRISEYSDRSAFTNIWNTSIKCILDSDMVPSKLFFTLSTNAINLSQKAITFWVNLKKKKIQNPEWIHLLCRFLEASWKEQFACQIIIRNLCLHPLLPVSHGSEVKLQNTSLICRTTTQLSKISKHLNSLIKFFLNSIFLLMCLNN